MDLAATLANAERVARHAYERKHISDHIRASGVDLVEEAGDVRFLDANTVGAADGRVWSADRVVIAVGGRASRLPIPGAELALTFEDVRSLSALPDRVCVIGAADTGCQLTSILADFGCRVWLLEYAPRIVPRGGPGRLGRARAGVPGRGASRSSRARRRALEPLEPGLRVVYRTGDETLEHRRRRRLLRGGLARQRRPRRRRRGRRRARARLRGGGRLPADERAAHLRGRGRRRVRACWSRAPCSKAEWQPRTPCWVRAAGWSTRSSRSAASPTRSTRASGSRRSRRAPATTARSRSRATRICCGRSRTASRMASAS